MTFTVIFLKTHKTLKGKTMKMFLMLELLIPLLIQKWLILYSAIKTNSKKIISSWWQLFQLIFTTTKQEHLNYVKGKIQNTILRFHSKTKWIGYTYNIYLKKNKNLKFGCVIVVKKLSFLDLVKHFCQSLSLKKKL